MAKLIQLDTFESDAGDLTVFEKVLRVSTEQAEIDACKIEHLVSAETTAKLQKTLQRFTKN